MSSPVESRPPAFWPALLGLGCCGGLMVLVVSGVIALAATRPPGPRRGTLAAPASVMAPVAPVHSGASAP
jgi:hypothetical protein